VHWQGCQTSAKAEHMNPEQSPELLRVELQACNTRIGEMRREIDGLAHAVDLRAEIIRQLWPDVLQSWSVSIDDDEGVVRRLEWDEVLSEEAADELRRIVGLS
jgi:hypothetical protein